MKKNAFKIVERESEDRFTEVLANEVNELENDPTVKEVKDIKCSSTSIDRTGEVLFSALIWYRLL